jgi:hypothetical protein
MPCTITPFRETDLHGEPVKVWGRISRLKLLRTRKMERTGRSPILNASTSQRVCNCAVASGNSALSTFRGQWQPARVLLDARATERIRVQYTLQTATLSIRAIRIAEQNICIERNHSHLIPRLQLRYLSTTYFVPDRRRIGGLQQCCR